MKLRIKGNSIRLRLLRSEVERFAAEGRISDQISFGDHSLTYTLLALGDAGSTHSTFENNEITVIVPGNLANDWATGDRVGIESEQPIGDGENLSLLIEKDFVCVGRPDDPDRADAFPSQDVTG